MSQSIKGFTAIEMAVVLSVAAIILGTGLAASKPILEKMQKTKTERKMEQINDRLASFVHRNNRLPCPANPNPSGEPFGSENGSGGVGSGSCVSSDTVGVVPFRAIGLKEDDIRDAWGNYITYHVSPAFAVNSTDVAAVDFDIVHEMCRSVEWVNTPEGGEWNEDWGFSRNDFRDEDGNQTFMDEYVNDPADPAITFRGLEVRDNGSVREHLTTPFSWYDHENYGGGPEFAGIGAQRRHGKFYWRTQAEFDFAEPPTVFEITLAEIKGNIETNWTVGIDFMLYVDEDVNDDGLIDDNDFIMDEVPLTIDDLTADGQAVVRYDANDPDSAAYGRRVKKTRVFSMSNNGTLPTASMTFVGIKTSITGSSSDPENINPAKARFCCPMIHQANYDPSTDIQIVDAGGVAVVPQTRSSDVSRYADKDDIVTGSVTSDIFVPAFTLISHGSNGHGAFLANGSDNRITVSASVGNGFGSDEVANSDGDNTYVYRLPDSSQDATYFDDIVMWRTQDQIYSEFGNQSCQTP